MDGYGCTNKVSTLLDHSDTCTRGSVTRVTLFLYPLVELDPVFFFVRVSHSRVKDRLARVGNSGRPRQTSEFLANSGKCRGGNLWRNGPKIHMVRFRRIVERKHNRDYRERLGLRDVVIEPALLLRRRSKCRGRLLRLGRWGRVRHRNYYHLPHKRSQQGPAASLPLR